jgi:nitrogen regulatory protein PII
MPKLIVLITARVDDGHLIGEAWQAAGAPGVTLVEGHGLRRLQQMTRGMEVLPGMLSLAEILHQRETSSLLVLSLTPDEQVEAIIAATERILGSLAQPDNGVLFVLDVAQALGLRLS